MPQFSSLPPRHTSRPSLRARGAYASRAEDRLVLVTCSDAALTDVVCDTLKRGGYRGEAHPDSRTALQALMERRPLAMVAEEARTNELGGMDLLRLAKRCSPQTVGVLCTSDSTALDEPIVRSTADAVIRASQISSELCGVLGRLTQQGGRQHADALAMARGMVRALAMRRVETVEHSERLAQWSKLFAEQLRLGERALDAELGGLLHDIGKVGVRDSILLKPGALSAEEWVELRRHPLLGADLLFDVPLLQGALDIVRFHHERWDGTGYPSRRRGKKIPVTARLFAICDAYEAITSERPHRPAANDQEARRIIRGSSGTHFDPEMVDTFLTIDPEKWIEIGRRATQSAKTAGADSVLG